MDKSTRNLIQRATQDARRLLETEFAEQLEGTFDILPSGKIPEQPGGHLDERQKLIRRKLIAAVEHKRAGGMKPADAIGAYLREAAFTCLNRFVALKMLEARELVQECISKAEQSAGFKEFCGLAPGLVALPDHGYRMYIECIFDEIGTEVKVLFDRRDPASLLWPRRQALHELLDVLNRQELAGIWGEDETIGWVYQYFNSQEERQQMRSESAAPRNSRELAVRNQFFTPRYVVQFLTDNTLGRIWYEMRKGDTRLTDQCQYLVRRPNEVFLAVGEDAPEQDVPDDLSQDELLRLPVYIPHRPKKDPRNLKILDPACGSGHFLLYCFDLLVTIYEEAWHDSDSPPATEAPGPDGKSTAKRLREDYADLESLRRDMLGLILRHNLHGIEIDPRCAQIAALSLWMRAQRAFNDFSCPRDARPRIEKTNIVVAEPMPGEKEMLREFTAALAPPILGQLVEVIFDKMTLAGEAGSLLKIEEEIGSAVTKAREAWAKGPQAQQLRLFGEQPVRQQKLDFSGIDDDTFWHQAEERIYAALREYSGRASNGKAFSRQMFVNDAEQGFAFIDVCSHRYDVALMNPPFGLGKKEYFKHLQRDFPDTYVDLYGCFAERGRSLTTGFVGAISSRSFLVTKKLGRWRRHTLAKQLVVLADLGWPVMDDALVESAAFVLSTSGPGLDPLIHCFDVTHSDDKGAQLLEAIQDGTKMGIYACDRTSVGAGQDKILYRLPLRLLRTLAHSETLGEAVFEARGGMNSFDDFRFVRLRSEVNPQDIGRDLTWEPLSKGGPYAVFYSEQPVVVLWEGNGEQVQEVNRQVNGQTAQARQASDYYHIPGATYSRRSSKDFGVRLLPADCIIGEKGPAIHPYPGVSTEFTLALLNSRLMNCLVHLQANAKQYDTGVLTALPWTTFAKKDVAAMELAAEEAIEAIRQIIALDETAAIFSGPPFEGSLTASLAAWSKRSEHTRSVVSASLASINTIVDSIYGTDSSELRVSVGLEEQACLRIDYGADGAAWFVPQTETEAQLAYCSYAMGLVFGRWCPGDCEPEELERFAPIKGLAPIQKPPLKQAGQQHTPPTDGILVLDPGHQRDLARQICDALDAIVEQASDADAAGFLGIPEPEVRELLRTQLFDSHLTRYSASRRKSPIYWELAISSRGYAVWLYYHGFTKDTLYKVLNDYVKPKLEHEQRKLTSLTQQASGTPTASQRGEIAAQETFVEELRAFREEIERVTPLWNPDLNDGVIINFAPLWRLVPQHRQWQKECKNCWDKLVAGDYDWSHLAMHLWPERVVPKCQTDRSLAIAHDLEDELWEAYEDDRGREQWRPKDVSKQRIDELIEERTSPAVKAALESLLNAPAPAGSTRKRRKRKAAR